MLFRSIEQTRLFFGIRQTEVQRLIYANHLKWAPDGDEAFDDGSNILQFDVGDRVRLIAFTWKSLPKYHHDPDSLREIWMGAEEFYRILVEWRLAFAEEWTRTAKVSESC